MPTPRIAIVGAGPAGCMLARLLHLSDIDAVVFEGEQSPDYRSQGGTLDLHTETGLAAMQDAGLFDKFLEKARYDGEYLLRSNLHLKPLMVKGTSNPGESRFGGQRPEIDRAELRRILTESLPEGMIQWGHHLKAVSEDGTLTFDHTVRSGFDLVIGAEGAWSKVRKVLSQQEPIFVGIGAHSLRVPDAANTAPELYKLVNRGSVFAHDKGQMLAVQMMGDDSINVYANFRTDDPNWFKNCGYDPSNLDEVKTHMLSSDSIWADWHPTLKQAISLAEGPCSARSLYMLPVGFKWPHKRGLTVLGDAAHLMLPFAGEGVNIALDDARKLASAIIKAVNHTPNGDISASIDREIAEYEKEMWPRTERVAKLTDGVTQLNFFTNAPPESVIAASTAMHVRFHTPWVLHPLATAMVYTYYFFKLRF
ncbi:uncharacterized protein E0L32_012356 [Thyridium curvatum]|uniref:FAD-binding domain-containing protein n=1 Tax=Thyridium curvatum TaxID=1093900 RepID=A0A507BDM2_9PEZI|nr:uncharacterized protein E0L32_012356 [Thyridium curvatum]TPX16804.1 hypothetical protein E0L32_012356 [Thyridium curvatum]